MPVFNYIARDNVGAKKTGMVDAQSKASAIGLLKGQGLFVVDLTEKKSSFLDFVTNVQGVPETDVVAFTRQFSTMISAGLPMAKALDVLAGQTPNKNLRKMILDALRDVEGGTVLSQALSRHSDAFSPTYQALVSAGEASGKLDDILKRLATTMEAERELKSKFKGAMIYPVIILIAMVGVFVMLMIFVIPKLAAMYESLNVELPTSTKFLIGVSDFFVHKQLILILAVAGTFLGIRWFVHTDEGKSLISRLSYSMPVFGKINRHKELTSFTRTLSLLIASAIPIVEALHIVSQVVQNHAIRSAAIEAAEAVEKGNQLSEYFKHSKVFPPLLGQMASVGEETGQMDAVLEKVAVYFEGETDHAINGLSAALEPIILVMLGGMVGVLIVSIITPIYKITSSI